MTTIKEDKRDTNLSKYLTMEYRYLKAISQSNTTVPGPLFQEIFIGCSTAILLKEDFQTSDFCELVFPTIRKLHFKNYLRIYRTEFENF